MSGGDSESQRVALAVVFNIKSAYDYRAWWDGGGSVARRSQPLTSSHQRKRLQPHTDEWLVCAEMRG